MTQDRAEFEAKFPPPKGVKWGAGIGEYYTSDFCDDPFAITYQRQFEVWQAAKASEAAPADYREGRNRLHKYLDENHGVIPLTDDLSEIERIVLSYAGMDSEAAQQAEPEPVAWMTEITAYDPPARCTHGTVKSAQNYQEGAGGPARCRIVPLYTPPAPAPVQQAEPEPGNQYVVAANEILKGRRQHTYDHRGHRNDGKPRCVNCGTEQPAPAPVVPEIQARHPTVVKWRNDAIRASADIADRYGDPQIRDEILSLLTAPQQEDES